MKMFNEAGQAVYFNRIMKNGKEQLLQFGTSEDRAKEVLRLCKSLL